MKILKKLTIGLMLIGSLASVSSASDSLEERFGEKWGTFSESHRNTLHVVHARIHDHILPCGERELCNKIKNMKAEAFSYGGRDHVGEYCIAEIEKSYQTINSRINAYLLKEVMSEQITRDEAVKIAKYKRRHKWADDDIQDSYYENYFVGSEPK